MDLKNRANSIRSTAEDRFTEYRSRWPPLEFGIEGFRRWIDANGTILAGHLAFRVFSFLVPLLLVLVAVLGFSSGSSVDAASESFKFGSAVRDSLSQAASDAHESRWHAAIIGGFAMLIAGAGLATALRTVYAVIWNVKPEKSAIGRLLIVGALILVVMSQAAGSAARLVLDGPGGFGVGIVIVFVAAALAVWIVSWVLPRRTDKWRDLFIGAVIGGAAFSGLNIASVVYFSEKLERSTQTYGALGVAVTVLLYLYVVGQILVVSAIVNTLWVDRETVLAQAHGEAERIKSVGDL